MDTNQTMRLSAFQARKLDATVIWLLFLFLGWSYGSMDQIGKQILFYITLGGLGFWTLYRLITLHGKIKQYNRQIALECGLTQEDMLMMGVF